MEATGRIKKSTVLNIQTDQEAINSVQASSITTTGSVIVHKSTAHSRNELSLQVEIQTERMLFSTVVLMTILVAITFYMITGFTVESARLDAKDTSEREEWDTLDRYSSYLGSIAAVLSMPFQYFVSISLSILFLCYTTNSVLTDNKSFVEKWGPTLAAAMMAWLLCQGLTSVNVKFVERVESVMKPSDLLTVGIDDFSFSVTTATNSARSPGIPSTDTILRNAIRPSISNLSTSCMYQNGLYGYSVFQASVRYGFKLNTWLKYLLPESVASGKSFAVSMKDSTAAASVHPELLPFSLADAAKLFSYGCSGLEFFSTNKSIGYDVKVDATDAPQMLTDMQGKLLEWNVGHNFSDVTFELSTFQLSPQIRFDAITFELETEGGVPLDYDSRDFCNEHACITNTPMLFPPDSVGLFHWCEKEDNTTDDIVSQFGHEHCSIASKSSVLIYSLAHHVAADQVNIQSSPPNGTHVLITNAHKKYALTFGQLSWNTSDLTEVYDTVCEIENECHGLYFSLGNSSKHLVLGETHLPTHVPTTSDLQHGKLLAIAENVIVVKRTTGQREIILPSMYSPAPGSLKWGPRDQDCSSYDSITDMIQRHVYSKDPVQPAYTAGLFWLFQNAAVRKLETRSHSRNRTGIVLDFDGNHVWLTPKLAMPLGSALRTFAGCFLLMLSGALIWCWSRNHERRADLDAQLSTAHNAAGILFNTAQFPPLLVRTGVQPSPNDEDLLVDGYDIHDYAIIHVTLRHKKNGSIRSVEVRETESDNSKASIL